MAASLEELLWEEGFKGRRSTERPRHSMSLETTTRPLHPPRRSVSRRGVKMSTERTRSDISRYTSEVGALGSDRATQVRPGVNFVRAERLGEGSSMRELSTGGAEESGPSELYKRKELVAEGKRGYGTSEMVKVEQEEEALNGKFKDIFSNEIDISDSRRSNVSESDKKEVEGHIDRSPTDFKLEKRRSHNCTRSRLGRTSSRNNDQAKTNEDSKPSDRSRKDALNSKSFDSKRSEKCVISTSSAAEPALDQVAIKAVISILGGHIKPFLHDENFQNSLRVNCFSSLNIDKIDKDYISDNKAISNLEQAIETVERAVAKGESTKDLKMALLQLNVITDLSSNDTKDSFTAEIPNFKLSACAHVYLSVIFKLQKKENLSAQHILQVFCISPFQARTLLLTELWEILFFPHLSHLKKWYTVETEVLGQDPSKSRKLRFLENVYNDILDSGTFQFASYYKEWLTEDTEAPDLPLIHIPNISVRGVNQKGSSSTSSELTSSPTGPFSTQLMVSRRLYEAVFSNGRHGADWNVQHKVNFSLDSYIGSSSSSTFEEKQTVICATEKIKHADQDIEIMSSGNKSSNSSQQEVHVREEGSFDDEVNGSSGNSSNSQPPCMKENELILRRTAISVFRMQKSRDSSQGQETANLSQMTQRDSVSFLPVDALGDLECLENNLFFANAPQDFICPLTGRLLRDPVTLETGQTFERAAITKWLQSGNITCPVTGKMLECSFIPHTNFILKRIVDNWKFDQLEHPENCDSQISCRIREDGELEDQSALNILEQLLTCLSKEECTRNANHFMSLGGLEFLLQRFEHGELDEAVTVAPLLLLCMEANPACRFQIERDINKKKLLNLLFGKPAVARKYGVTLLSELRAGAFWLIYDMHACLVKDHKTFFSSLPTQILTDSMHILLLHLQSLPLDRKPLIAISILHFDLLLEPQKYSIYRDEVLDSISKAMDSSLTDESVRTSCCRALLILWGHTSVSSIVQTGSDTLMEVGCKYSYLVEATDDEGRVSQDKSILLDDEEQAREAWSQDVAMSLLGSGRISFVDMLSKCLGSRFPDLVKACLTTVAWLSLTLASLPDDGFHLSTFSALLSQLKDNLENNVLLEHRVLASVSLHNFSKFAECRVLLMTIADQIYVPLRELGKITWAAKELYTILYRNDLTLHKEQLASKIKC